MPSRHTKPKSSSGCDLDKVLYNPFTGKADCLPTEVKLPPYFSWRPHYGGENSNSSGDSGADGHDQGAGGPPPFYPCPPDSLL